MPVELSAGSDEEVHRENDPLLRYLQEHGFLEGVNCEEQPNDRRPSEAIIQDVKSLPETCQDYQSCIDVILDSQLMYEDDLVVVQLSYLKTNTSWWQEKINQKVLNSLLLFAGADLLCLYRLNSFTESFSLLTCSVFTLCATLKIGHVLLKRQVGRMIRDITEYYETVKKSVRMIENLSAFVSYEKRFIDRYMPPPLHSAVEAFKQTVKASLQDVMEKCYHTDDLTNVLAGNLDDSVKYIYRVFLLFQSGFLKKLALDFSRNRTRCELSTVVCAVSSNIRNAHKPLAKACSVLENFDDCGNRRIRRPKVGFSPVLDLVQFLAQQLQAACSRAFAVRDYVQENEQDDGADLPQLAERLARLKVHLGHCLALVEQLEILQNRQSGPQPPTLARCPSPGNTPLPSSQPEPDPEGPALEVFEAQAGELEEGDAPAEPSGQPFAGDSFTSDVLEPFFSELRLAIYGRNPLDPDSSQRAQIQESRAMAEEAVKPVVQYDEEVLKNISELLSGSGPLPFLPRGDDDEEVFGGGDN